MGGPAGIVVQLLIPSKGPVQFCSGYGGLVIS